MKRHLGGLDGLLLHVLFLSVFSCFYHYCYRVCHSASIGTPFYRFILLQMVSVFIHQNLLEDQAVAEALSTVADIPADRASSVRQELLLTDIWFLTFV